MTIPRRVCVDTHALIWHLSRPAKLGRVAKRVFKSVDAGRTEALVPAIVLVELALLQEAGRRLVSPREVADLFERTAFRFLPVDVDQALEFHGLTIVREPFDRLVVCAARCERVPLVTADTAIEEAGVVDVIWD